MKHGDLQKAVSEGIIDSYFFDIKKKALTMHVVMTYAGVQSSYDLEFLQISHLQFDDEGTSEWEKLELTELWVDESPDQSSAKTWAITLNFWDLAQMVFRCGSITVNGENLL